MKKSLDIPVVVQSGAKYINDKGHSAIKNGVKASNSNNTALPKPTWLRVKHNLSANYAKTKALVQEHKLATVCEEAKCPNISECWSHGTATIMLMGAICTRACKFCAVDTGNPRGWLDENEPSNTAKTVALMNLDYVVLTSVNRDDLADGGAKHYADTVKAIKLASPKTKIEVLTPDFQGDFKAIALLLDSGVDVFAQNVETVERLTHPVRDNRAGYLQTLKVLEFAKGYNKNIYTKTSLMLGLGETTEEIIQAMDDMLAHGVQILTLGQYLQPTSNHLKVERYVTPEEFNSLRELGLSKGFFEVAAGPMVRSSYRADKVFKRNNLDLDATG